MKPTSSDRYIAFVSSQGFQHSDVTPYQIRELAIYVVNMEGQNGVTLLTYAFNTTRFPTNTSTYAYLNRNFHGLSTANDGEFTQRDVGRVLEQVVQAYNIEWMYTKGTNQCRYFGQYFSYVFDIEKYGFHISYDSKAFFATFGIRYLDVGNNDCLFSIHKGGSSVYRCSVRNVKVMGLYYCLYLAK